jgi:hypothetical protein
MQVHLPGRDIYLVVPLFGMKMKPPTAANRRQNAKHQPRRGADAEALEVAGERSLRERKHNRGPDKLRIAEIGN